MSKALSSFAVPGGKRFLSAKKLDSARSTWRASTFHSSQIKRTPSKLRGDLLAEYPIEPARKKSEASPNELKIEPRGSSGARCTATETVMGTADDST